MGAIIFQTTQPHVPRNGRLDGCTVRRFRGRRLRNMSICLLRCRQFWLGFFFLFLFSILVQIIDTRTTINKKTLNILVCGAILMGMRR